MPNPLEDGWLARFRGEAQAVRAHADRQVFQLLWLASTGTCLLFVLAMLVQRRVSPFLWPILVAVGLQFFVLWWTRRPERIETGVAFLATVMTLGLSGVVYLQGGAHAPGLVYGLTTVAVVLIAGRRGLGVGLALWLGAWTGLLTWAKQTGRLTVAVTNPLGDDNARLVALLVALLLIGVATHIAKRRQQALDAILERALVATESERDAAQALADRRARTVAEISHEIRTPMTGIVGAAQLLAQRALSPGQRQLLSIQRQSAERLLQLVNALLDQARAESMPLVTEQMPFAPRQVAREVAELFAAPAHRKGVEIVWYADAAVPGAVMGDAIRVRQILSNLVSNAVKFTDRGAVELRLLQPLPGRLQFEVSDTGRGFPASRADALFQPFVSEAHGEAGRDSTGLGLPISRQLARAMGGELSGRGEPGQGSCFVFELPCEAVAPAVPVARPARPAVAGLLWVIGASQPLQRQLASLLAELGTQVRFVAQPPDEALWRQGAAQPQALMVDIGFGDHAASAPLPALMGDARRLGRRLILVSNVAQDAAFGTLEDVWQLFRPPNLEALAESLAWAFSDTTPLPAAPLQPTVSTRVLLADDNAVNQVIGRSMLEAMGTDVVVVQDGREALEQCLERQFDIVLMDLQMPVMDGLEATRRLRAHELAHGQTRRPVVAVTGQVGDDIVSACRKAGIDGILAKPYTLDELRVVVESVRSGAPA
jgi:signal transduction histidine kinase/CheY-like chemotaxis protein